MRRRTRSSQSTVTVTSPCGPSWNARCARRSAPAGCGWASGCRPRVNSRARWACPGGWCRTPTPSCWPRAIWWHGVGSGTRVATGACPPSARPAGAATARGAAVAAGRLPVGRTRLGRVSDAGLAVGHVGGGAPDAGGRAGLRRPPGQRGAARGGRRVRPPDTRGGGRPRAHRHLLGGRAGPVPDAGRPRPQRGAPRGLRGSRLARLRPGGGRGGSDGGARAGGRTRHGRERVDGYRCAGGRRRPGAPVADRGGGSGPSGGWR